MANIGGLNLFIVKLLNLVAPFFAMYYLYCLAGVFQGFNLAAYRKERKAFLSNAKQDIDRNKAIEIMKNKQDIIDRIDAKL